tara:strand:+ start:4763 stop:4918 length:156 start_codon:yes stop_codon:yes gene_type:complete
MAVSSKTIVKSAGYLGKLLNIYKKARFFSRTKELHGHTVAMLYADYTGQPV